MDGEREAYEKAYAKVREQILADKFEVNSVLTMDKTLDDLKAKVMKSVTAERGYRAEALKFVENLKAATRLFDAATVDYAQDILIDTKDHDATTVAELIAFMLKYRLQFASAERSPTARELYAKLYDALRQQTNELGIKSPDLAPKLNEVVADPFQVKSVWTSDENRGFRLTVTERKGDMFQARLIDKGGSVERLISGTIKNGKISWYAKDVVVIKGNIVGGDNHGTYSKGMEKIDFVWQLDGKSGTYSLKPMK